MHKGGHHPLVRVSNPVTKPVKSALSSHLLFFFFPPPSSLLLPRLVSLFVCLLLSSLLVFHQKIDKKEEEGEVDRQRVPHRLHTFASHLPLAFAAIPPKVVVEEHGEEKKGGAKLNNLHVGDVPPPPHVRLERGQVVVVVHEDVNEGVPKYRADSVRHSPSSKPRVHHAAHYCVVVYMYKLELLLFEDEQDGVEQLVVLRQEEHVHPVRDPTRVLPLLVSVVRVVRQAESSAKAMQGEELPR
mmetsp:Transcript_49724/g.127900  ORF Transcript_49724/g.127900 Transcript_49724/m.127900 type:complete len:242 (+) Transcript_49724:163-888(+)